jgi:hypothetical protein
LSWLIWPSYFLSKDNHTSIVGIREYARLFGATSKYVPIHPSLYTIDEKEMSDALKAKVSGLKFVEYPFLPAKIMSFIFDNIRGIATHHSFSHIPIHIGYFLIHYNQIQAEWCTHHIGSLKLRFILQKSNILF